MIDFDITGDQEILLDTVQRFVRQELEPAMRASEAARTVPDSAVDTWESLGLMALEAPGEELGMLTRCLVNEVLGHADPGAALALDRVGPAAHALWAVAGIDAVEGIVSDRARRAWLATADDGALRVGNTTVNGVLHWAPAGVTDLCLVTADGIALVRGPFPESALRGAGLRAAAPVRLELRDAPVTRFTGVDPGPVVAAARLHVASLLVGVLEAASSYARGYAMERVAFGRPIAHHQALTFLLMDMHTAVTGARLLLHEAAWRFDAGAPAAEAAATAFAEAAEQSAFIGPAGVQVLGGLGFMQDYPVEKHMREARALGLLYGGLDRAREDAMRDPGARLMAGGLF
jgi:alkylation response protein AidB-like acyl-CoA dehydrogenase